MRARDFDAVVEAAVAKIPPRFRSRMNNVVFVVEPEPPSRLRTRGGELLGLYEGRPLTGRSVAEPFAMPDRITIFQGPHERQARGPVHLRQLVEETVWHEVAHYFGMDERQVRSAERRRARRGQGGAGDSPARAD